MTFNFVIGNPPYQEVTGENGGKGSCSAIPIYQYFIALGTKISTNIIFIINNSWMYKPVKIDKLSIAYMIESFGVKRIINYPVIEEIFKDARVTPCIIQMQKGCGGEPIYESICNGEIKVSFKTKMNKNGVSVITHPIEMSLLDKVDLSCNMAEFTFGTTAFGLSTNVECTGLDYNLYRLSGTTVVVDKIGYNEITDNHNLLSRYKLICGRIINRNHIDDGVPNKVITNIHILQPYEVCTGQFSVIGQSISKNEIAAMCKYYKTKFVRAMIGIGVPFSASCSQTRTRHVPFQNFGVFSDINWDKSVSDIDKQLYRKYNLSDKEIEYIENNVIAYE